MNGPSSSASTVYQKCRARDCGDIGPRGASMAMVVLGLQLSLLAGCRAGPRDGVVGEIQRRRTTPGLAARRRRRRGGTEISAGVGAAHKARSRARGPGGGFGDAEAGRRWFALVGFAEARSRGATGFVGPVGRGDVGEYGGFGMPLVQPPSLLGWRDGRQRRSSPRRSLRRDSSRVLAYSARGLSSRTSEPTIDRGRRREPAAFPPAPPPPPPTLLRAAARTSLRAHERADGRARRPSPRERAHGASRLELARMTFFERAHRREFAIGTPNGPWRRALSSGAHGRASVVHEHRLRYDAAVGDIRPTAELRPRPVRRCARRRRGELPVGLGLLRGWPTAAPAPCTARGRARVGRRPAVPRPLATL